MRDSEPSAIHHICSRGNRYDESFARTIRMYVHAHCVRTVGCNGQVDPGSSSGVVAADEHSAHAQNFPSNLVSLLVDTDQWLLREARSNCDRSLV